MHQEQECIFQSTHGMGSSESRNDYLFSCDGALEVQGFN